MRALKRAAKLQLPEKAVALLVVAAVALMLVPMLVVARYNVPCADDYHYGASTYHTWQATHSLAAVLRGRRWPSGMPTGRAPTALYS